MIHDEIDYTDKQMLRRKAEEKLKLEQSRADNQEMEADVARDQGQSPAQLQARAAELRRLLMPGEMGERFKLLALTRDFAPLGDLTVRDMRPAL